MTPPKDAPTAPAETAVATAPTGLIPSAPGDRTPVRFGLAPTTLEEGWRLAQMMAQSTLVPKSFIGKPYDVLIAIQLGIEIGFAPMQALNSIAVINGRPSVWGDGFLALIMASKPFRNVDEYYEVNVGGKMERRDGLTAEDLKRDDTAAVCTFHRRDRETPITRRFTIAQAKKAGLLTKEGPWQNYPDRMLAMRARSFAGRDGFADVLRGMTTVEEASDLPPMPPIDVPPVVQRISETPAASAGTAAASAPVAAFGPAAADVVIEAGVKGVETFLGEYIATLTNGQRCHVPEMADATELEKFVGTSHKLRLTCVKADDGLRLKTFAIAE
jgi:hypothetical protein